MSLLSGVLVPDVVGELSTVDILTTRWVDGEKLCDSTASDVRQLCNTLLNAYLIQLLETGFLHADPHPGNLIRTTDGRICILDMGLMTEVGGQVDMRLMAEVGGQVDMELTADGGGETGHGTDGRDERMCSLIWGCWRWETGRWWQMCATGHEAGDLAKDRGGALGSDSPAASASQIPSVCLYALTDTS